MAKIIELKRKPSKLHSADATKKSITCITPLESRLIVFLSYDIVELKSFPFEDVSKLFF